MGPETEYVLPDASQTRLGQVNTLAHYIALHDDLYCQMIFQNFATKQYYSLS